MNARLVSSLILARPVLLFVPRYAANVEVRYLLWTVQLPRALLIFIVLAVGILIGWLLRAHFSGYRPEA